MRGPPSSCVAKLGCTRHACRVASGALHIEDFFARAQGFVGVFDFYRAHFLDIAQRVALHIRVGSSRNAYACALGLR